MLSLEEFIALCKQYCPEWKHHEDWTLIGEYWVSFNDTSKYALCTYQYNQNKIFMPYAIIYEDGDYIVLTDKGEVAIEWGELIKINAEDTDAKDRVIAILAKLHQDYKQIQTKFKLKNIKEDF